MVLTSQMAFIERWDDKNLRVTGTVFIHIIIINNNNNNNNNNNINNNNNASDH